MIRSHRTIQTAVFALFVGAFALAAASPARAQTPRPTPDRHVIGYGCRWRCLLSRLAIRIYTHPRRLRGVLPDATHQRPRHLAWADPASTAGGGPLPTGQAALRRQLLLGIQVVATIRERRRGGVFCAPHDRRPPLGAGGGGALYFIYVRDVILNDQNADQVEKSVFPRHPPTPPPAPPHPSGHAETI